MPIIVNVEILIPLGRSTSYGVQKNITEVFILGHSTYFGVLFLKFSRNFYIRPQHLVWCAIFEVL
jgi:hypothetical protein